METNPASNFNLWDFRGGIFRTLVKWELWKCEWVGRNLRVSVWVTCEFVGKLSKTASSFSHSELAVTLASSYRPNQNVQHSAMHRIATAVKLASMSQTGNMRMNNLCHLTLLELIEHGC